MNFGLQSGNRAILKNPKLGLSDAELKKVGAITIRLEKDWPLSWVHYEFNRCDHYDTPFTLLVKSGDTEKPWLKASLDSYEKRCHELSEMFAIEPLLFGVHITGCTPPKSSAEHHWYAAKGSKTPKMTKTIMDGIKRTIDFWHAAFPTVRNIFSISLRCPDEMRELIDYGKKVAGGNFLVEMNSLKPDTLLTAPHVQLLQYASSLGLPWGTEPAQPLMNKKDLQAMLKKRDEIATLCKKKSDYTAIYPDDIKFI